MLRHEIKSKVLTIDNHKGQTVYYAYPKSQQKLINKMLVERVVRKTSFVGRRREEHPHQSE